jgi:hypothetical protein
MKLPIFGRSPSRPDESDWDDGDDGMAEILDWYAVEVLSPDAATLSRIGGRVRAAFVRSITEREPAMVRAAGTFEANPDDPSPKTYAGRTAARRRWSWSRRRAAAAICAVAILTLSTVGFAAAESGPGQPFYRLRLGIETVNLPAAGSQDRLAADLGRAQARIDDVAGEAAGSNWNAAADAAGAYRQVIAGVTLPAEAGARDLAVQQLDGQLARLEELRAGSHGSETAALDGAIAALCSLLGISAPALPAAATPGPVARPSDTGRKTDPARPSPTEAGGGDQGGGRDQGDSPEPGPSGSDPGGRGGFHGPGSSDPGYPPRSPSPTYSPNAPTDRGSGSGQSPVPSPEPSVKR